MAASTEVLGLFLFSWIGEGLFSSVTGAETGWMIVTPPTSFLTTFASSYFIPLPLPDGGCYAFSYPPPASIPPVMKLKADFKNPFFG